QAAARHQCSYLVGLHMGEFLRVGGNPVWLQGLHCAPQKLRNLNEINKLLAHRPWDHIPASTSPPALTLSGLREPLSLRAGSVLLLADGEGVTCPPWLGTVLPTAAGLWGRHIPNTLLSPASDDSMGGSGGKDAMEEVEVLMERMKLLQESQLEEEGVTQEEMATRFELEKTESLLVAPSDIADHSLQSNVLCFVEDPEFGYKDFTRRGEQAPPTFRAQ
ncbi:SESN2 protein, partial [Sagittarius serpentarius]|nr:SESN2 protein [Sagittarius serpentarius]